MKVGKYLETEFWARAKSLFYLIVITYVSFIVAYIQPFLVGFCTMIHIPYVWLISRSVLIEAHLALIIRLVSQLVANTTILMSM
jgi:hypothetical protein